MRARQIASAVGMAKPYFYTFWRYSNSPSSSITESMRTTGSIFIHIPKTAGMSIHKTIYGRQDGHGHAPAIAFQHRDSKAFENLFKFTLMREPTDRFVSAFYYLKTAALTERDERWGKENLIGINDPNEFLAKAKLNKATWGRLMSWVHFNPQHWYMTDRTGNVLLDYVGRVEEFDKSMTEIAQRLGKEYTPARVNKSKRPTNFDLTKRSLDILREVYAEDYLLYNKYFADSVVEA